MNPAVDQLPHRPRKTSFELVHNVYHTVPSKMSIAGQHLMGMKQTLDVINRMEADRIIGRYAIAGAVAAYNYIEPTVTEDVDILVAFDSSPRQPQSGLVTLGPVLSYLKDKGYSEFRKEGILIEGWAVQFIPVASDLDAEALAKADDVELEIGPNEGSVKARVLRPEYLIATALRVGRPKDRLRIAQFLDEAAVGLESLCDVIGRHGLGDAWLTFCGRAGIADPCKIKSIP
jgi:hypothetical protein